MDYVHFLVQSAPMYNPKKIVQLTKSITAQEIFMLFPKLKKNLWGRELWIDGYFVSSVGKQGDTDNIYKNLHK